nr:glucosidase [Kwoniella mangroviensis CBS 8507]OCF64355.1 glucosidase [Kwoniella mangroviensis CBS 8507]
MSYQAVPLNDALPPPLPPKNAEASSSTHHRTPSDSRRYGPRVSAQPVPPTTTLLPPSDSSSGAGAPIEGGDQRPWGTGEHVGYAAFDGSPEADDWLHNPDPKRDGKHERGSLFTVRGATNIGCLALLAIGIIALFAGYPIIDFYTGNELKTNGAYNLGGINSTGQVPLITNFPYLIDEDTPQDAYDRKGFDGEDYHLVWSDEFNKDGRTFFPGDDPYWTAVDIHYWPTGDFEWYDPSAVTTKDGNLVITMTQEPIHDLNFKSGMIQSWNQLCFQYSFYIEVRVSLPGNNRVGGFWPGVWTMGNLGRAGYGGTTEGLWPYTYDSCDIGTLKNQTNAEGTGPPAALNTGSDEGIISYLPGQRLSACTCKGEDHPGPDESYGRGAPEVDVLEGQIDLSVNLGELSQSFQVAPFDEAYQWLNSSKGAEIYDDDITKFNSYVGGIYQEAVSAVTHVQSNGYYGAGGGFGIHGVEMFSDPNNRDNGHITWVADGAKTWTVFPPAVGPSPSMQIGQRIIPEEPMYMIVNFGMSNGFQAVNWNQLEWPATMLVDYVRVYQREEGRIGCDPADRPTADYIARHMDVYTNANVTTWAQADLTFPVGYDLHRLVVSTNLYS